MDEDSNLKKDPLDVFDIKKDLMQNLGELGITLEDQITIV